MSEPSADDHNKFHCPDCGGSWFRTDGDPRDPAWLKSAEGECKQCGFTWPRREDAAYFYPPVPWLRDRLEAAEALLLAVRGSLRPGPMAEAVDAFLAGVEGRVADDVAASVEGWVADEVAAVTTGAHRVPRPAGLDPFGVIFWEQEHFVACAVYVSDWTDAPMLEYFVEGDDPMPTHTGSKLRVFPRAEYEAALAYKEELERDYAPELPDDDDLIHWARVVGTPACGRVEGQWGVSEYGDVITCADCRVMIKALGFALPTFRRPE